MSKPRKPTTDERIQALTQSLELLASLHSDMEKRQKQDAAAIHQLTLIARDALASVQSLERIATTHQRLDDHGQRIERLEDQ